MFINNNSTDKGFEKIQFIQHETLTCHEHIKGLNRIKLLEDLPEINTATANPLSAYLLLTPFQSKHINTDQDRSHTKPNNHGCYQTEILKNKILKEKMKILKDELQNIHPRLDQLQEPEEPAQDIPETLLKPDGFQIGGVFPNKPECINK